MQIITYIILACWAVFILFWSVSAFNVKRDIDRDRNPWRRLAWLRIVIFVVIIIFLLNRTSLAKLTYYWGSFRSFHSNFTFALLGAILCVLGIALAVWARVHLGRNWSSHPNLKEDHELITSGPYQLVRHPIYTGISAAMLGTAFVFPAWRTLFFVAAFFIFIWRIKVEEDIMTKQVPNQYPEYKKRTWALVPWVW